MRAKGPPAEAMTAKDCDIVNSIGMRLKYIPSGTFMLGSPDTDKESYANERPAHEVRISTPFYLGDCPVTQRQWKMVMGADNNPSYYKGDDLPVENVSWEEAKEFCRRLSELPEEKAAGRVYGLPTEAQWEYACRAGTRGLYFFGDDPGRLGKYAWFEGNSKDTTHPVGSRDPNPWGLYDMHGNVCQWCEDWFDSYRSRPVTDPVGGLDGFRRVYRGGAWNSSAWRCRDAARASEAPKVGSPTIGFRVALPAPPMGPGIGKGSAENHGIISGK
jgi:formylglycine-generating enzyme required for sulfatase activity